MILAKRTTGHQGGEYIFFVEIAELLFQSLLLMLLHLEKNSGIACRDRLYLILGTTFVNETLNDGFILLASTLHVVDNFVVTVENVCDIPVSRSTPTTDLDLLVGIDGGIGVDRS